jgi:DNA mismatch repair ATPase MutS
MASTNSLSDEDHHLNHQDLADLHEFKDAYDMLRLKKKLAKKNGNLKELKALKNMGKEMKRMRRIHLGGRPVCKGYPRTP